MLSQPPIGKLQPSDYDNYVYRTDTTVDNADIYHAEVGINQAHQDFLKPVRWLYTGFAKATG